MTFTNPHILILSAGLAIAAVVHATLSARWSHRRGYLLGLERARGLALDVASTVRYDVPLSREDAAFAAGASRVANRIGAKIAEREAP